MFSNIAQVWCDGVFRRNRFKGCKVMIPRYATRWAVGTKDVTRSFVSPGFLLRVVGLFGFYFNSRRVQAGFVALKARLCFKVWIELTRIVLHQYFVVDCSGYCFSRQLCVVSLRSTYSHSLQRLGENLYNVLLGRLTSHEKLVKCKFSLLHRPRLGFFVLSNM
jgi:hypothetical protein